MKCSIIILNWNTKELLQKCIDNLFKFTNKDDFELIIVDNGSNDSSVDYIKTVECKKIFNPENVGFAAGVNQGIKTAEPLNDILLLNSDAMVQGGWLSELYKTLENNKDKGCGLVSSLGNNGNHQFKGQFNDDTAVFNLYFYCVLISRTIINSVGLLDERFKVGNFEDIDYCVRARLIGGTCFVSAKSLVLHEPHQSFKKNNVDDFKVFQENAKVFEDKWRGFFNNVDNIKRGLKL